MTGCAVGGASEEVVASCVVGAPAAVEVDGTAVVDVRSVVSVVSGGIDGTGGVTASAGAAVRPVSPSQESRRTPSGPRSLVAALASSIGAARSALASSSSAPMQMPTARPSSSSRTVPSATGLSMRSFSRCCICVPSLAVASTPTAVTWPAVFVPAAVTGSPGPRVAAWPLARVGVGCAISSTAVPDAGSMTTTVACCSLPSGMTAVTCVIPATIWADVTSWPLVTAAAVPDRFELPVGITSCTTPGTTDGGTVEATVTTGAVVAAVTRTTVVATSSVAGCARWAT